MLKISGTCLAIIVTAAVVASATTTPRANDAPSLAAAVPDDVFLFIAERNNPKSDFLDEYWGEVYQALSDSGIGEDLMGLIAAAIGEHGTEEVERMKTKAMSLIDGVDWDELCGKEMVFAERFDPLSLPFDDDVHIVSASMAWLFRGDADGVAKNHGGLVAILEGIAQELNNATQAEALKVTQTTEHGARVARLNLLAMQPGASPLTLSIASHGETIIIGFREELFEDCLNLSVGQRTSGALATNARFNKAFAELPPAQDTMFFFDMQAMIKPLRDVFQIMIAGIGEVGDVYHNQLVSGEAAQLNARALSAYRRGDSKAALDLIEQAYEAGSRSSIVLYNLACFNALEGNQEAALEWLVKAIDGGFYAPRKIASDSDLKSVRDDERFTAAVARAKELAGQYDTEDIVVNSTRTGEAYRQTRMAYQACEKNDYQQALEKAERACGLAPDDPRSHYCSACCHALMGHDDSALASLEKAVELGFYCPRHISKDEDLARFREHERFKAILAKARAGATQENTARSKAKITMAKVVLERLTGALGIIDYVAVSESTEGYSTRSESYCAMVDGAKNMPFYPVLSNATQLNNFDRYLPKETLSFSVAGGFDLGAFYTFMIDTFHEAGPVGEELLAQWDGLQEQFGFNVERDMLSWVSNEMINVTLEDGSSVFLMRVDDEAKAREKVGEMLTFLNAKLAEAARTQPVLAMINIRMAPIHHDDLEGFEGIYLPMSPQPMVWGVADQHLIFGTSADAVATCLKTARGAHPGVRDNERVMAEALIPQGAFTAVTLTDQRQMGQNIAQGVGFASMMTAMVGSFSPEAQPVMGRLSGILTKLGPVFTKIDFYKSTATVTTFDGTSWRSRAVTHYASPTER